MIVISALVKYLVIVLYVYYIFLSKVIASCSNPEESEDLATYLCDNGRPPAVQMLVNDSESVDKAYKLTRELTTFIDVFINNAGTVFAKKRAVYHPTSQIYVHIKPKYWLCCDWDARCGMRDIQRETEWTVNLEFKPRASSL